MIKLLLPECLREFPKPIGCGTIPRNTVTITRCDRRVNRVAGEEGEGSHPVRRATQQRGCQPQRIDQEPTGRSYCFSHVVPCNRRESVTTGEDPGREGNPRRGKEEQAVRRQLGCSSTVQADLTRGKREREGLPRTKKYEHGGPRRGHDCSITDRTDCAPEERVQYQRAGPPGLLLHR